MPALIGTYLLSLFVAQLAALHILDRFGPTDADTALLAVIAAATTVGMIVLVWARRRATSTRLLNHTAIAVSAVAVVLSVPMAILLSAVAAAAAADLLPFLLLPILIAILVQWGLMRQRWHAERHTADLVSTWPWFTTAATLGAAVLGPAGPALVPGAARPATVLAAAVGALILTAAIESYIRRRIVQRQLSAAAGPRSGRS